jgi:hypothetical protein
MVPGAAIVIELPATDAASPLAEALLEACNHGPNPDVHCALASDTDAEPPSMIAVVAWQSSAHLVVEVQVGVRDSQGPEWSTRRLTFTETDVELERWRAVGLVIATLARQRVAEASPAPPPLKPAPPPRVQSPRERPARLAAPPHLWTLEAAGELARGPRGVFGAYGGSLRLSRRVTPRLFYATASARYGASSFDEHIAFRWGWLTAGLGIVSPLGASQVSWEMRLEPMVGVVSAKLDSASGSDAASGMLWGLGEGVALVWWSSSWLGFSIAADAYQLNRATVARASTVDDAAPSTQRLQPFGWSTSLGLKIGLD